jgi:hypothetical protein
MTDRSRMIAYFAQFAIGGAIFAIGTVLGARGIDGFWVKLLGAALMGSTPLWLLS